MAGSRAEKTTARRRDWHQRRIAAARTDPGRLAAAYDWFLAELTAYTAAGWDASRLSDHLAEELREAARQLSDATGRGRRGR